MTTAWTVVGPFVRAFRRCGQRGGMLRPRLAAYSMISADIKTLADIKTRRCSAWVGAYSFSRPGSKPRPR